MSRPTSACLEQQEAAVTAAVVGKKQFTCGYCNRLFTTKGNLLRHIQATHVGGQTFPCPTCGKDFKRKEDRTTHMRVHTGEAKHRLFAGVCCKYAKKKRELVMSLVC